MRSPALCGAVSCCFLLAFTLNGAVRPRESTVQAPLSFEANQGQADAGIQFISKGGGYAIGLKNTGAVLQLGRRDGVAAKIEMRLRGANPAAGFAGLEPQSGKSNYLLGNDPKAWATDIPHFGRVRMSAVYPGVDLIYYGNQRQLEYDFSVAPGADANRILMSFDGADSVTVDEHGELVLKAGKSEIRQRKPVIYQEIDGVKREVGGGYALRGRSTVGFQLARYDHTRPLVIDPVLAYSTFFGGSGDDVATAVAVDSSGNIYVTGWSFPGLTKGSPALPTTSGAYKPSPLGGYDAFVTKFDPTGKNLIYSTFLGGNDDDIGLAIAVDTAGNAYVTGTTFSTNFPTSGAFQNSFKGGQQVGDGYMTKLNSSGNGIMYSTYFGGSSDDQPVAIAVDASNMVYLAGETVSSDFPRTSGAFQSYRGGVDGFVSKINPAVSGNNSLLYSTFFGGSQGDEFINAMTVNSSGNVYITGSTTSSDFPTSSGALRSKYVATGCPQYNSNTGSYVAVPCQDAFVAMIRPTSSGSSSLGFSTLFGGTTQQQGLAIGVDSSSNVYIGGNTNSGDFPVSSGAFQKSLEGSVCIGTATSGFPCSDAFLAKLDPNGATVIYSTYIGGDDEEQITALAVDQAGIVYATGVTYSTSFPLTAGAFESQSFPPDAFIVKVNPALSGNASVLSSTYLGGFDNDYVSSIALDNSGNAYIVGSTSSQDFPVTTDAYKKAYGICDVNTSTTNCERAFLSKITFGAEVQSGAFIALNGVVSNATGENGGIAPGELVVIYGFGLGPKTAVGTKLDSTGKVSTNLGGTTVTFSGIQAPILGSSDGQLNVVVPYEVAGMTTADLQVQYNGTTSNTVVLPVFPTNPGIFITDDSGQGAIINADGTVNSSSNPAAPGSTVLIYATGGGVTNPASVTGSVPTGAVSLAGTTQVLFGFNDPRLLNPLAGTVQYAGSLPGAVSGAVQLNVVTPSSLHGQWPVAVAVNNFLSSNAYIYFQ